MNKTQKSKAEMRNYLNEHQYFIKGDEVVYDDRSETDIIARMEAAQQRFGRLQLTDTPPESERQILRCAPPFDAQAEHEADLRYESRVDYESWQTDNIQDV